MMGDIFGGRRARPTFTPKEKEALYAQQKGICKGCGKKFEMRNMAVDHIRAFAKGGGDRLNNLQLLCTSCNSLKGVGTMTQLKSKLSRQGITKAPPKATGKVKTTKKPTAKKPMAKRRAADPFDF